MTSRRLTITVLVLVAVAVVLVLTTAGCERPASDTETAPRVLLIGIDGLDWGRVAGMIDEGRLPNLAGLIDEGSSGILHSVYPYLSPSIWTSIATGKVEEKHAIHGFLVDRGLTSNPTPTSSDMREARAFWQILSDGGYTVGVTGWLVTWPAEIVNGYMVSSRISTLLRDVGDPTGKDAQLEKMRRGIHPAGMLDDLLALKVMHTDLTDDDILRFLGTDTLPDLDKARSRRDDIARFYASDLTSLRMADHLMESIPTELVALYLRGLDLSCHTFWKHMEPDVWPDSIPPEMLDTFSPVIERYYGVADSMIGELLKHRGPETVVIICSDHGFAGHRGYPGFDGELAVGISMHREDGVIIMSGPGIRTNGRIEGASILDVTPTLLALFDLPVGSDMDGRVLTEAIDTDFLDAHPLTSVESHERREDEDGNEPISSTVDDEVLERLRSLGYIE